MSISHLKLSIAMTLIESVMNDHRDEPEVMDCLIDLTSVDSTLHDVVDHFETEDIAIDVKKAEEDAKAFLDLIMETSHDNVIHPAQPSSRSDSTVSTRSP